MEDSTPLSEEHETLSPRSAAALRELQDRARTALSAQHGQMSRLEEQITRQLDALTAAIADERAAEADGMKEVDKARAEVDRLRKEAEESRAAWQAEKTSDESKLAKLRTELESVSAQQKEKAAQLEKRSQALEAQQAALDKQASDLAEREANVKKSADTKSASNADIAELERERNELQQKFELALQDVQRFRGRAADLEQELARRPQASQTDSAELVALRAERDALAERVEQLEKQPAVQVSADAEQEISDLRRRFELAVEDVRDLKTKNAQLEAKLADGPQRPAASGDGGGMDWESQKRRLLESLQDATDDEAGPLPQKDRLTIENTIEMTDAVVAEKDREIEQLKSQLASASVAEQDRSAEKQDEQVNQLLDADEVIAEHRKRIATLEQEMEAKLRAAELELSVERAKLAREKVELEELKVELESKRHSYGPSGAGAAAPAEPRRRWLSKLGLGGDEQG
jgi:chromosome segregation ATPase